MPEEGARARPNVWARFEIGSNTLRADGHDCCQGDNETQIGLLVGRVNPNICRARCVPKTPAAFAVPWRSHPPETFKIDTSGRHPKRRCFGEPTPRVMYNCRPFQP